MRKLLVAFAVLGTFAMVANANDITFYFGRPEYYTGTSTATFVADSAYPGPAVPGLVQPPGTYTLGIWANVGYDAAVENMDVWNAIAINVVGDPGLTVSNLTMDNFDHRIGAGTAYRWESSSDFGGGDNGFLLASVTRFGLGGLWTPDWGMGNGSTDWWSYTDGDLGVGLNRYWLGNVTLSSDVAANVYFQVGTGAIVRSGGSAAGDLVWFGEDEVVPLHGNDFLEVSSMPDFVFTPEPASLILLSLAGLFLRRR